MSRKITIEKVLLIVLAFFFAGLSIRGLILYAKIAQLWTIGTMIERSAMAMDGESTNQQFSLNKKKIVQKLEETSTEKELMDLCLDESTRAYLNIRLWVFMSGYRERVLAATQGGGLFFRCLPSFIE